MTRRGAQRGASRRSGIQWIPRGGRAREPTRPFAWARFGMLVAGLVVLRVLFGLASAGVEGTGAAVAIVVLAFIVQGGAWAYAYWKGGYGGWTVVAAVAASALAAWPLTAAFGGA